MSLADLRQSTKPSPYSTMAGEEGNVIEEGGDDRTLMKGDSSGGVNHPFSLHPSFINRVITRAQKVSHQDHNSSKSTIGD